MLWDNGWYGGHHQASYSLLFAPLAGSIGLYGAAALWGATATWAFDRLVFFVGGQRHRDPVILFAIGTVIAVAIGQLPFLAGEAAGLLALLVARRDRMAVALVLAMVCGLFSEVAGVLLVLAAAAWVLTSPAGERRKVFMFGAAAALPIVVLSAALPGLGPFPFRISTFAIVLGVSGVGILAFPRRYRIVRVGYGITWVSLPDVALDYSAVREAQLLNSGLPYLRPVWRNAHWRVWAVVDSPGLVSGPAHVTQLEPHRVTLAATGSGSVLVRVRYTPMWNVSKGRACIAERNGVWTRLEVMRPGPVELTTSLLPTRTDCDARAPSNHVAATIARNSSGAPAG